MADEFTKFKLPQKWIAYDYLESLLTFLPDGFIWIFEKFILDEIVQDVIGEDDTSWEDSTDSLDIVQDTTFTDGSDGNILRRVLSCFASELERIESSVWASINQSDPGVAIEILSDWENQLGLPESCFADLVLSIEERQRIAHAKLINSNQTANIEFYETYAESLGFDVTVEEIPEDSAPRIMGVAIMGVEPMGGYGGNSILRITVNSGTSDVTILQCAINKIKPAHITITWVI